MDSALARTVLEYVHCGDVMQPVAPGELPITAPLMVLLPGTVPPEREEETRTYRCACGFTLDDPTAA
ncbi:hypothetical protein AHIS1636_40130 [Arthrobacter mangrovi]|uniref:Uncharacterized protein n=1 Tax=Arthrobacter mangrovi TaxID=2966350 RepID=A0ABQ5N006_9MICC|nr:hypothetical protein AHIS1636_40130 [Arthrobacter mangrovi]